MTSLLRLLGSTISGSTAVTIGKFDGVHLGHRALVEQLLVYAKSHAVTPLVLILEPHPQEHFTKQRQNRLMSLGMKYRTLRALGVPHIGILPFHAIAHLAPQDFITDVLIGRCRCSYLAIGDNFRFGHKQQGTVAALRTHSAQFITECIGHQRTSDGVVISSSRIKQLLHKGEITYANQLLGEQYTITGKVASGKQRGRMLGFPTANLYNRTLTPLAGVYCGYAQWQTHEPVAAVANIGHNPTFESDMQQRIEVHLLDTNPDLYGMRLNFMPTKRIRQEQRFDSKTSLQAAITQDVAAAKAYLGE